MGMYEKSIMRNLQKCFFTWVGAVFEAREAREAAKLEAARKAAERKAREAHKAELQRQIDALYALDAE